MSKRHELRQDSIRGEFDEVCVRNARIHIERMGTTAFWMQIDAKGLPSLVINTGVHRGVWYFDVWEDGPGGRSLNVERPRGRLLAAERKQGTPTKSASPAIALSDDTERKDPV